MGGRAVFAFIDVLFLLLIVFVLLPHKPETQAAARPPGTVLVEINWPDDRNADVDLWVLAPNQRLPVGYSNLGGRIFNLLRDDLGFMSDPSSENREFAYTRGAPTGEYVVNVHYFQNHDGNMATLPVEVIVSTTGYNDTRVRDRWREVVDLTYQGEEVTAVRFRIDENHHWDGVTTTLPKPLRLGGSGSSNYGRPRR